MHEGGAPWLALAALGLALGGCRITPEEVKRIEVENQLLRHEIQTVKEKCQYYDRELELQVEDPEAGKER